MRLVENWKSAWKWFSVWVLTVLAAIPLVWPSIPPEVQDWLPLAWRPWVLALLAVGGIAGRMVSQTKPGAE